MSLTKNDLILHTQEQAFIQILQLAQKTEIETAMWLGVKASIGDVVFESDSPVLDFDLTVLWQMYQLLNQGNDVVLLTPKKQKLSSKIFYNILTFLTQKNYCTQRLCLLSRKAIYALHPLENTYFYRSFYYPLLWRKIGKFFYTPTHKTVKENFFSRAKKAIQVLLLFSNFGISFSLGILLIGLSSSLGFGVYVIFQYIYNTNVVSGWTTIMLFLSLGFTGLFLIMLLLLQYLIFIFRSQTDKKRTTIQNIQVL